MSFDSKKYWINRYDTGGFSGSGSRGNLSAFKIELLNQFVKEHDVKSVVELGSGDGYMLKDAVFPSYIGYDISPKAVQQCQNSIKKMNFRFEVLTPNTPLKKAELALSLDVLFHLIEDSVFDNYLEQLFTVAQRYVIIYANNLPTEEFRQKYGVTAVHVKNRKFTDVVKARYPGFELVEVIPNRYPYDTKNPNHTSFCDFYVYKKTA